MLLVTRIPPIYQLLDKKKFFKINALYYQHSDKMISYTMVYFKSVFMKNRFSPTYYQKNVSFLAIQLLLYLFISCFASFRAQHGSPYQSPVRTTASQASPPVERLWVCCLTPPWIPRVPVLQHLSLSRWQGAPWQPPGWSVKCPPRLRCGWPQQQPQAKSGRSV